MKEPTWVLNDVVQAVHSMLLAEHGGGIGIRDKDLLDSALARAKQKYAYEPEASIFELAAAYSFGIAKNHPFVDGNGRTARAFASLVMMKEGYDIKKFFAIEEHFDRDLDQYYEAFFSVDRQSEIIAERDMSPWLEYFTRSVALELVKIKEKVKSWRINVL